MFKRMSYAVLWFFAAWTTAAMLAYVLALPGWIVPVVAATAAVAVLRPVGNLRRVRVRSSEATRSSTTLA